MTFDANGGSGEMDKVYFEEEDWFEFPECGFEAPYGCKFNGWLYDGELYQPGQGMILYNDSPTTITADWLKLPVVSFDAHGGSGEMEGFMAEDVNIPYNIPECEFIAPEGKTFDYWSFENPDAWQYEYRVPGDVATLYGGNTTLVAIWKDLTSVSFDANGGTGTMEGEVLEAGSEEYTLPECTFTAPEGKTFMYWELHNDESGFYGCYNPGDNVSLYSGKNTIVAAWKDLPAITFDAGEGSGIMAGRILDMEPAEFTLPDCEFEAPEGKTFDYWYVSSPSYSGGYYAGETITLSSGITTITALWKDLPSITFDAGEGSGTMDSIVLDTEPAVYVLPECEFTAPAGMQFYYWSVSNGYETFGCYPGDSFEFRSGNYTVTAVWQELPFVVFNANGGEGDMELAVVPAGENTFTVPECTFTPPSGLAFSHWSTDPEDRWYGTPYNVGDTMEVHVGEQVLYAIWKEKAPEFTTNSMTLGGSISMNFFVDMGSMDEEFYPLSYVEFTVNGKSQIAYWDEKAKKENTERIYKYNCKLNSISMADEVEAVLLYYDANGNEQTITTVRTGEQYLEKFSSKDREVLWNIIKGINDYGYYMQRYLSKYATAPWTLGEDHIAMKKAFLTHAKYLTRQSTYRNELLSDDINAPKVTNYNKNVERVYYSLVLDTDTAINFKIKLKEGYSGKLTVKLDGKKVTPKKLSDGRYQVTASGISAHKLADFHKVEVITDAGTSTFEASALSYAYEVIDEFSPTTNAIKTEQFDAMAALYEYYKATIAYKASQAG